MNDKVYFPVVPIGDGTGASTNIEDLMLEKTLTVTGAFSGLLTIEISADGLSFVRLATFERSDVRTVRFMASHVRISRQMVSGGVKPVVSIGAKQFAAPDNDVSHRSVVVVPAANGDGVETANVGGNHHTIVCYSTIDGELNIQVKNGVGEWFTVATFYGIQSGVAFFRGTVTGWRAVRSRSNPGGVCGVWITSADDDAAAEPTKWNDYAAAASGDLNWWDSVNVDTGIGPAITMTLPVISPADYGKQIRVGKTNEGGAPVFIGTSGGDLIDGLTSGPPDGPGFWNSLYNAGTTVTYEASASGWVTWGRTEEHLISGSEIALESSFNGRQIAITHRWDTGPVLIANFAPQCGRLCDFDTTGGNLVCTLPIADATNIGKSITVKKVGGVSNKVTVTSASPVEGGVSFDINDVGEGYTFIVSGSGTLPDPYQWRIQDRTVIAVNALPSIIPTDAGTLAQWLMTDEPTNKQVRPPTQPLIIAAQKGGQNFVGGIGTYAFDAPGVPTGSGLRTIANNTRFNTADGVFQPVNQLSISFWCQLPQAMLATAARILWKNGQAGTTLGAYLYCCSFTIINTGEFFFDVCDDDVAAWPNGIFGATIKSALLPVGEPFLVTGQIDAQNNGRAELYINGKLMAQSDRASVGPLKWRGNGPWMFGQLTGSNDCLLASFCDLRIEQVMRSAAYLQRQYQLGR